MTRRLDPETKALGALTRALEPLDPATRQRILLRALEADGTLEVVRRVRLAETLRWSRSWIPSYETRVRERISRALQKWDPE